MGHTRSQYEARIRQRIGDLGLLQHVEETQFPLALEEAILTFSNDKPRKVSGTLSGDGTTRTFDLDAAFADFALGWSRVVTIEHPVGNIPPTRLDAGHDWEFDEETAELTFYTIPSSGTDNIKVTYLALYPFPDDTKTTDLVPDVFALAIASKAAASVLRAKGNEFARQQSTSVAGDLFRRDPSQLFEGAGKLDRVYTDTVLGRPRDAETKQPIAMAVSDVAVFPHSLFHNREHLNE